jgi:hypothetical protein
MHTYSINSSERSKIPFMLAGISIGLILLLKYKIVLPSWIPVPGVFALYGILYGVFDKWLWKWEFLSKIGLISTPNLNGTWKMLSRSSMNDYEKEYEGIITINQTWTSISIYLDGEKFSSISTMAGIDVKTDSIFTLKWEYLSQKKPKFSDKDYMHTGMTRVLAENKTKPLTLKGDYFTDRSRHNYGSVTILK